MDATGQSHSNFLAQGAGVRQLTPWQNTEHLHQNNAADKVLELLFQNMHLIQKENKDLKERCANLELKMSMDEKNIKPTTSKEPVMRSKSAPESYDKHDIRKASSPKIFLFPEMNHRIYRHTLDNKSQESSPFVSADGASGSVEGPMSSDKFSSSSDRDSCEFLSLRDSVQEPPGVSSQYFNNVINELVKTKNILHDLQMKQKQQNDSSPNEKEIEKIRYDKEQLQLYNQQLQRALQEKELEIAQLEEEHVRMKEDSFELSSRSDVAEKSRSESNPSSQGSAKAEIQRLREEVDELTKQNQLIRDEKEELESILLKDKNDIKRELMQKNEAYERLQENVKIFSECLQEEKVSCKNLEERLRIKTGEVRKISAQLGSLRQKYEELCQEKKALEKTRSLEDYPSLRYSSQRRTVSSEINRSGGSYHSREMARYSSDRSNSSTYNQRTLNIQPMRASQNDLSSELKPSNLPQFGAMSSSKFECPRCLKTTFESEVNYFTHLYSCIE